MTLGSVMKDRIRNFPAALTEAGVILENPHDEIGPSSSERGAMARREVGLAG
jgi:hypothetical protein